MDVSTTVTTLDVIALSVNVKTEEIGLIVGDGVSETKAIVSEELSLNVSVDTVTDGKGVSDKTTFCVKDKIDAELDVTSSVVVVEDTIAVDACSRVDWVKKDDKTSPVEAKATVLVKTTPSWEENESIGETSCDVVITGDGVGNMKVVWVAATTVSDPVVVLAIEESVSI